MLQIRLQIARVSVGCSSVWGERRKKETSTPRLLHGVLGVEEITVFDQYLSAHARVDARGGVFFVARAVDMACPKPNRRQPRVDIVPVVVVICHVEMAGVLVGIIIRVADQ